MQNLLKTLNYPRMLFISDLCALTQTKALGFL